MENILKNFRTYLFYISFDVLVMIAAISLILVFSLVIFFKKDKYSWLKQAPSLITTMGIFCTFVGITVGILRFDPDNEKSLHFLLDGLKLAFIPSALAILISIGFKWIFSKYYSSNLGAEFISKIDQNTEAVARLAKAIELIDWQVSYRDNLEKNLDYSSQLLALLENSLSGLISSIATSNQKFAQESANLENVITKCKVTLTKVNNDLNIIIDKLNLKVKQVFESVGQQEENMNSLAGIYDQFSNFNQTIRQLGVFSEEISNNLKLAIHSEIKEMEEMISRSLKNAISQHG